MNTIKLVQITKGVVSTRYSALFLCLLPKLYNAYNTYYNNIEEVRTCH